ncbi:MAG: hypothetical protein AMJ73_08895 [candidate division Zixibacteria bacterium SM1_73]|nr:MAG: hypothetical protein AMJ73_08895 [candidate division Zixibacteria bacterium SM1_73]
MTICVSCVSCVCFEKFFSFESHRLIPNPLPTAGKKGKTESQFEKPGPYGSGQAYHIIDHPSYK